MGWLWNVLELHKELLSVSRGGSTRFLLTTNSFLVVNTLCLCSTCPFFNVAGREYDIGRFCEVIWILIGFFYSYDRRLERASLLSIVGSILNALMRRRCGEVV